MNAVIQDFDSMSDEEGGTFGVTGAFPSSSQNSIEAGRNDKSPKDKIFVNKAFQVTQERRKVGAEGSRGTAASSSQEGLMALSRSSSDTLSMSNTAAAVVDSLKKKQVIKMKRTESGGDSSGEADGIYPFNIFRSFSMDKKDRLDEEKKHPRLLKKVSLSAPKSPLLISIASTDVSSSLPNDFEGANGSTTPGMKNRPSCVELSSSSSHPSPLLVGDKTSSSITDEHHHQDRSHHSDGGGSLHDYSHTMSFLSHWPTRAGRNQYRTRHILASSQQLETDSASLLRHLFIGIEAERHMNRLAALHLRSLHSWFLFFPAILLTLGAGVIVLVFEADLNTTPEARVYASIAVGVSSLMSVFWQALNKQLDMATRAALHDATSTALKRLSEDILFTLSATDKFSPEYVCLIGEKASQAIDSCCPSRIPVKLNTAFSAMSDRMILMLHPPIRQTEASRKCIVQNKLEFIWLYTTAYDELSAEIINYIGFPIFLPSPRRACDTALRNFKTIVTEGKNAVGRTRHCLKQFCPCITTADEERSLFDVIPAVAVVDRNCPIRNSVFGDSV